MVIIRLHGPGRQDIEKLMKKQWNTIVSPRDEELRDVAGIIDDMMDK